jgi:Transposase IS116/IS110/IS902 family
MPAAQADPWHRPFGRNGDRGFDWQRRCVPQGARVRRVDGSSAEAVLDRRQGKLSGISKRGNRYLRKILIHGARAMVLRCKRERIPMGAWMTALETRAPRNVLIVAAANKLARIAWAVLSSGQDYRAVQEPVAA